MSDSNKKQDIIPFSEVTEFHGHACPGTAIGYRASETALKRLGSAKSLDEEFVAVVENDSCSVDAIQVVTGCTMGKGNLIFKDHGKQAYTFINRNTGDALRVSLKRGIDELDPKFSEARKKVFSGTANDQDEKEFEKQKNKLIEKLLKMPENELFKIERIKAQIPQKAMIFKSVECAECGEPVSEHRARVKDGKMVCIPCFEDSR